jgi:hypothetical protein
MKSTPLFAALMFSTVAQPALASAAHPAPAGTHALTHEEEVKLAACKKMKAEDAHHDAQCVKLMEAHPDTHK